MATHTFTPSDVVDMSKERDWAAALGMMDWDNTSIVFTKRTLLEFLKYTGTTVDTNYSNIQKLPRYAKFGKISEFGDSTAAITDAPSSTEIAPAPAEPTAATGGIRPTRRVRAPPGGQTNDLFGHYVDDDALAGAPPHEQAAETGEPKSRDSHGAGGDAAPQETSAQQGFRPTRRVREMPGGRDSLAGLL